MTNYPALHETQKDNLLGAMREQIAKKPSGWRNGFWSVTFPSNSEAHKDEAGPQCEYVAELGADGVVIVRTLDGDEVTRGALGWIWNTAIFRAYRVNLELSTRANE